MSAFTPAAPWASPTSRIRSGPRSSAIPCARRASWAASRRATIGSFGAAVLGLEADASLADMVGTNTCFAYSGFYVSSYCRARVDGLGTLAGRLGWALPGDGRTLLYGKGGLAWEHERVTALPNDIPLTSSTRTSGLIWGWVLGGGVERALNRALVVQGRVRLPRLRRQGFATPASVFQSTASPRETLDRVPQTATSISQDVQQVKVGLNYRFGRRCRRSIPPGNGERSPTAPPAAGRHAHRGRRALRVRLGALSKGPTAKRQA